MSDRIEQMRIELMNDLYHVMGDPERVDAILNPSDDTVTEEAVAAPVYFIAVASKSTPGKVTRYDVTHVSSSPQRNVFLLHNAMQALFMASDDDTRSAIKDFIHALIDAM